MLGGGGARRFKRAIIINVGDDHVCHLCFLTSESSVVCPGVELFDNKAFEISNMEADKSLGNCKNKTQIGRIAI